MNETISVQIQSDYYTSPWAHVSGKWSVAGKAPRGWYSSPELTGGYYSYDFKYRMGLYSPKTLYLKWMYDCPLSDCDFSGWQNDEELLYREESFKLDGVKNAAGESMPNAHLKHSVYNDTLTADECLVSCVVDNSAANKYGFFPGKVTLGPVTVRRHYEVILFIVLDGEKVVTGSKYGEWTVSWPAVNEYVAGFECERDLTSEGKQIFLPSYRSYARHSDGELSISFSPGDGYELESVHFAAD